MTNQLLNRDQIIDAMRLATAATSSNNMPCSLWVVYPKNRMAGKYTESVMLGTLIATEMSKEKSKEKTMTLRCIVACQGGEGPDLYFVKVVCSQKQYDNGDHYEAAIEAAKLQGYGGPFIAFDENDRAGKAMLGLFEWETASTVDEEPK